MQAEVFSFTGQFTQPSFPRPRLPLPLLSFFPSLFSAVSPSQITISCHHVLYQLRSARGCCLLFLVFAIFRSAFLCRGMRKLTWRSSAMGKSRSATICIAYLLHKQRSALTPQSALALIRETRPLCEPNDGFMEQLNLYHEMGCPDEVTDHPVYQRWLYRREVEESVACGRAPEMKSVRFEDEQPQQRSKPTVEIKCRRCRSVFLPQSRNDRG